MARHQLRSERRDIEGYVVVMDPSVYCALITDRPLHLAYYDTSPGNFSTIFGVPVKLDSSLRRGQIVLRHEVAA